MISDNKPRKINTEHSVNSIEEKKRIEDMGGIILRNRLLGELSVSRSFGDSRYKPYVLTDPEIIEHKLIGNDEFLVLGTDGFWNVRFLSN